MGDVVAGPPSPEVLISDGQFAHQGLERGSVGAWAASMRTKATPARALSSQFTHSPRTCGSRKVSRNKLRFSGLAAAFAYDAFHLTEELLTQPLQIIIGSVPGAFGSYRDGFELFNRARSAKKDLFVVDGASHYDLHDQPKYVDQALKSSTPSTTRTCSPTPQRAVTRRPPVIAAGS
jgi:fermentation-respiration switch protein FrsA (DUF1100 family)